MFRKDDGARSEWSEAGVAMCAQRSRDIVSDVWPALRPGGLLIYSTCTFNRAENEDNVAWIARTLGADVLPLSFPADSGAQESGGGYHFFPHRVRGEGFFLALLQKKPMASAPARHGKVTKQSRRSAASELPAACRAWLTEDCAALPARADTLCAMPRRFATDALRIEATLPTLHSGLPTAQAKGRKLIPTPELALSTLLRAEAFPRVDLCYADAIKLLRCESLLLPAETPRGYVLALYEGLPLGFLNNLGTRANNLYPTPWRIRMA